MKTHLDVADIDLLEDAALYLRDKLLIRLLARTGCRISEALGIAVDDIDSDRGTVTIEHLKTRLNLSCPACSARLSKSSTFCSSCGQHVERLVSEEKEHRRQRQLPLDDDTVALIREYIDRGGATNKNGKRLLFGVNRRQAWSIVRDCARRAGLPSLANPETGEVRGISPHRLRDAFAVHAVKQDDSGDGLRLLQEHLGHGSIVTTMRYRKISGDEHREWYSKLWGRSQPVEVD